MNSHLHLSNDSNIVIFHNGIIENYDSIKTELTQKGYTFQSETDTEVLVNLIQYFKDKDELNLSEAVRYALNEVIGAYAIAVMEKGKPDEIVVARLGSQIGRASCRERGGEC